MHTIRNLAAQSQSIRAIAAETGLARNTVRKYLRGSPEAAPHPRRSSKLDPFNPVAETLACCYSNKWCCVTESWDCFLRDGRGVNRRILSDSSSPNCHKGSCGERYWVSSIEGSVTARKCFWSGW